MKEHLIRSLRSIHGESSGSLFFHKLLILGLFLPIKYSNILIFIFCIYWIVSKSYIGIWQNLINNKNLILLIGFFSLYVAGLLYSENIPMGLRSVEKKIGFLFFPILIGITSQKLGEKQLKSILVFYSIITLFIGISLTFLACFKYLQTNESAVFYSDRFVAPLRFHYVYFSFYTLFAFFVLFNQLSNEPFNRKRLTIYFFIYIFFFIILFECASKNALPLFLLVSVYFVFKLKTFQKWIKISFVSILIFVFASSLFIFKETRERFKDSINSDWSIINKEHFAYNEAFSGTTLRLVFWKISTQHLIEDGKLLAGVGTGSSDDFLNNAYLQHGLIDGGYKDYNLHNQFFEILIELGLIGLSFYLFMLFYITQYAIKNKDTLLCFLVLIIIWFGLTESVLNLNKGVVFFSLFFSFLTIQKTSSVKNPSLHS